MGVHMADATFSGFPKECLAFFAGLEAHNNKQWFEAHRDDYERNVLDPARSFVVDMGAKLKSIAPKLVADPRTNKSLFRINRDTRFSKDKRPYKTNLGIWLWEPAKPGAGRMDCSGFYLHITPETVFLGCGIYQFSKPMLAAYRKRVANPKHGAALRKAIAAATKKRGVRLGDEHYKRVPKGFDPDSEFADLLKHAGVTTYLESGIPASLHSRKLLDYCFDFYKASLPMHQWLVELTKTV